MPSADLTPLLDGLRAARSPQRRSAARRLRKLGDRAAGPVLLDALRVELTDPRTWETQCQMIMALGTCGATEARLYLEEISSRSFAATTVQLAIGDTLVRLADDPAATVISLLERAPGSSLLDGAFRAMAMLRLVPAECQIERIVAYARGLGGAEGRQFWILAAAPGWPLRLTELLLEQAERSPRADVREAAHLARAGKYKTWRPL